MKLVVNGDDLGYTMANTLGIFQACRDGILRSTTVLTNSKYFEKAAALSKEYPELGVGVHMTLTIGRPLTENSTLHAPDGNFWRGSKTIFEKNPDYDEVYREWKAQIERYIEVYGHMPTHLDSHHHVHLATREATRVAKQLAEEYGLEMRGFSRYKFVGGFYRETATKEVLLRLLEENRDSDIELMCHPGWCDLELYRLSSVSFDRVKELDVLCDPEVIAYIKEHQIELGHY